MRQQLVVALFVLALGAPMFARFLRPGAAAASIERELRKPARFPGAPASIPELLEWPRRVEAWHADSLGLRDQLLRGHNALELLFYRRAPNSTLFLGRDGWIFLTGDDSRPAWRGLLTLEPSLLEEWVRALRQREAWFAERGIAYLRVCAPNKETIYPEQLPACEAALGPTPREQLLERFARESEPLPFLDLTPALREEKRFDRPAEDDFVFHPHGSHWTARGAFAGVRAIVERLRARFPALVPPRREDFERRELFGDPGDTWAQSLSLEDLLRQRIWDFAPKQPRARCVARGGGKHYTDHKATWENERQDLPAMLLVTDSFGPWVHPLLAEHAAHLVFAWKGSIGQTELVAARPALVIELYVERRLLKPPQPLTASLRLLDEEEFLGMQPLAAPVEGRAALQAMGTWLRTTYRLESDGLHLQAEVPNDKLLLPPLAPGPGRHLALHFSLRAPRDTIGTLWCQTAAQPEYLQRERLAFDVHAGENEIYVEIPLEDLQGRILYMPGLAAGEYVLHAFEARAQ
jgi:hypothetical protein